MSLGGESSKPTAPAMAGRKRGNLDGGRLGVVKLGVRRRVCGRAAGGVEGVGDWKKWKGGRSSDGHGLRTLASGEKMVSVKKGVRERKS